MLLHILFLAFSLSSTFLHANSEAHSFISCHTRPCDRPSGFRPHPRIASDSNHLAVAEAAAPIAVTSTNWSGYVAALNLNNPVPFSVSVVGGSWIVPDVHAMGSDTWCSFWVGIDGAGSPTVEQIGTEHDIRNGVQHHYAWYEMFPLGSVEIVGFPVEPGDQITASVAYIPLGGLLQPNNDLFILQIFNNTKKMYTSIPYITTSRMQRVCAEWVVEAPWLNKTLPLSNFGSGLLFNCSAVINNIAGSVSNPSWQHELMSMVDVSGIVKAVPSDLSVDGKSFSVAWKHS